MNKKSSLSLSVNAIVVLIIAITMLGLGLGFVRGLFGGAAEKFTGIIAEESDPEVPTASSPVTLSRSIVLTSPGEDEGIKISLYNPTNAGWDAAMPGVTCAGLDVTSTANSKAINQGKYGTFGVLLDIPVAAPERTYLCNVQFTEGGILGVIPYSSDFTIKVQHS